MKKLASEISSYLHSKHENLDFKPSDIQGLIDGKKAILDVVQVVTQDIEGGDTSQDGMFLSICYSADWNKHRNRWEINTWNEISGHGLNWQREVGTPKQRDDMSREIFLRDHRILPGQAYFEMVGQIRLVKPVSAEKLIEIEARYLCIADGFDPESTIMAGFYSDLTEEEFKKLDDPIMKVESYPKLAWTTYRDKVKGFKNE